MTFGEHLEELRRALLFALGGLLVGFLLGLAMANYVVEGIKRPLQIALETFYASKSLRELDRAYGDQVSTEIENFIREKKFVPSEIYVESNEIRRITGIMEELSEEDILGAGAPRFRSDEIPSPTSTFILTRFWKPLDSSITTLSAQEPFLIWLKAGLVAGIVLASPWMLWHIWAFVAAGLYAHEKRYVYIFMPFSVVLFLAGVALAYFFVFKPVLNFLLSFNQMMNIDTMPRLSEWLSFFLFLPLGFGISFQLPLVMLFLERIGVVTVENYLSKWRIAILVIFTLAMFLTPADPISMLLMAIPLTLLYFGGVALCQWMPRLRRPLEGPEGDV